MIIGLVWMTEKIISLSNNALRSRRATLRDAHVLFGFHMLSDRSTSSDTIKKNIAKLEIQYLPMHSC